MAATTFGAVAASFGRDLDAGLRDIHALVGDARRRGARMVVLPESALGGYLGSGSPGEAERPPAIDADGPEIRRLVRIAGPTVVCAGFTERGADGEVFNSAVCVSGDGVLGLHRKVHLPPSEVGHFACGDGFRAFDTPLGRVGMLICYDKSFPEAARTLAIDGALIVACLSAWPVCRVSPARRPAADVQSRHFDVLDRARAIENQVVWVSANLTGRRGGLRFPGRAKVVGPDGEVRAATRARGGIALGRVDLAEVARARALFSHLDDRRPAAYGAAPVPTLEAPLAVAG